jgi:hypothetical protein
MPLSVFKLLRSSLQALTDKMANRLSAWKGKLLQRSGQLSLIKTMLLAIPVYMVINIEPPHGCVNPWRKSWKAFCGRGQKQCMVTNVL